MVVVCSLTVSVPVTNGSDKTHPHPDVSKGEINENDSLRASIAIPTED